MNKEEIYFAEYKGKTPTIEDFVELETKMYTKEQFKKHIVDLYNQLDKSNNKIEKIKEYITSYESISLIQGLDDIDKNKNLDTITITEMTNRYLKVHDNILSIIDGSDE